MRRFAVALLLLLMLALAGCGIKQSTDSSNAAVSEKLAYSSDTSPEDCYLCGDGIESLMPSYWGQNNIALISLNTFEIRPIEINRYDRLTGQLIEEYAGVISFGGGGSMDGGFSASLILEYDRGYADGSVDFHNDKTLDADKAATFLCADCLNKILPREISKCFGVGAIHLGTKEIRLFEKNLGGFGLGDFHIGCDLKEQKNCDSHRMDLLIFYCPIRYEGAVKNSPQTREGRPAQGDLPLFKRNAGKKSAAKQVGQKTGKIVKNYFIFSGGMQVCQGLDVEFVEVKTTGNESGLQNQTHQTV